MLTSLGFGTLFEFILVAFVVWAIFNEDKFIRFEKRIAAFFRRRKLKVVKPSVSRAHSEKVYQR